MQGTTAAGLVSLLMLLSLAGCTGEKPVQAKRSPASDPIPVRLGVVRQKAAPIEVRAIGNVQPYSTVSVKPEIGGQITRVDFTEGQDVNAGDLLFTIDPRPFEASLHQAEANLARDTAQAKNAESEARRYAELFKNGVVAAQQYDQVMTNAEALKAAIQADEAAIQSARVNLSYTTIRSPINGRTGSLLVHRGNVVKANETQLVIINQIQPIYVAFSVPSQFLAEIKRHMASTPLKVSARPKEGGRTVSGRLTFVDNAIDVSTGTILLKGAFPNEEKTLWPGEFVDVTLTLSTQLNAIVAPSQAIQTGQQGQFAFVVKPDLTVEARPVVVGRQVGGDLVIEKGLRPGEKVVTDGQMRLVNGAKIREAERGEVPQ